jgi:hypothetical protein
MLNGMRNLAHTLFDRRSKGGAPLAVPAGGGAWIARDESIMGTAIRVELWAEQRGNGEAAIDAVMAEMHRIDRTMSPYKHDSELSRINREAARHAVRISEEMFNLIERAIAFSALSEGAFDITFASVGFLYDYRTGKRPTDAALAAGRAAIDYRNLLLDSAARTVRFAREGVQIDLGGFRRRGAAGRGPSACATRAATAKSSPCCRSRTRRSRRRATTSASSSATACGSITSSIRQRESHPVTFAA